MIEEAVREIKDSLDEILLRFADCTFFISESRLE